jgi:hypothetical protein
MGLIGTKRKARMIAYYACIFLVIAIIWAYFDSIKLGIITALNYLAESFD